MTSPTCENYKEMIQFNLIIKKKWSHRLKE